MNTNKVIRFLMMITVLMMQITFLFAIAKDKYESNNFTAITSILIITVIVIFGHKYLDLHQDEYSYEKLSVVIWTPLGAIVCYLLNLYSDLGVVLSAGIIGTLASFIPMIDPKSNYLPKLPPAIYCGVFVGMSSSEITPSITFVISAGTLAGIFLLLSKNSFIEVGGKLGTMAFLGVSIIYLINWLLLS